MAHHQDPCISRIYAVIVFLLALSFIPTAQAQARRTVRIAAEPNLPMAIVNKENYGEGFFMDIARYVARREGWELKYVACEWDRCLSSLKRGEIDILAGIAYSVERGQYADFSEEIAASNWGRVYAPKGGTIDSFLQLEGKRVAGVRNDTHSLALQAMLKGFGVQYRPIEVQTYEDVFKAVEQGKADAGVVNRFFGLMYETKYSLLPTNIIFNPIELRYAVPKGRNKDLIEAIDRNVNILKADQGSLYYQSLRQWTGFLRKKAYPDWIKWAIFSLIAAACVIIIHNMALRMRVKARTELLEKEIVERSRVEESLLIERERQLALSENSPFGMVMVKADGRHSYINPKFVELFGYDISDVPDRATWFSKAYPDPVYREKMVVRWTWMLENALPGEGRSFENRVICANGTEKIINFRPVKLENDEMLVTSVDITDRKRTEDELTKYRDHLEELVRDRTAELEEARERAESADHLKSAFLATMSHELRTPLNSIIGFTGLLVQGLPGPLNEEQKKQLHMVQNSSRHLLELINDVLDISKIEAGQLNMACEVFDVGESIRKAIGIVSPLAERKDLALYLRSAEKLGMMTGDKRRLEQVLMNLLNNSVKFTDKGYVEVSCAVAGPEVLISVKDTGIGIAPEDLEKVFKPFQQVDTGLSRRHEGTGLGLSITKKLIDMMGGRITVESTIGKGSTFSIVIPVSGGARG